MTSPGLNDDRIEAMRGSVMTAVDRDIRRRGRRARRAIGLTAASVLVVGVGGYALSSIDLQGSSSSSEASSSSESSSSLDSEGSDAAGGRADARTNKRLGGTTNRAVPDADRQVVTTGSVSVTVTRPRQVAARLSTYVEGIGGRVDDRSESGDGQDATATLRVRVPATKVAATIARLEEQGTVEDVSLENQDVTSVSQDLDARIDALEISVDRLESILGASETSKEVISAESALTKRQEQLESLQSQRRSLAGQVELSTITIDLAQEPRVDSVEPGGFSGGLRDGWNGLVTTVNAVVEVAGRLLPWAAVAVVVAGAVRLVTRRRAHG
ncbi:DUF4349 domain-containing protein [Aeromicrobium yanjiei]|uniref:DUF4349 domain-containing protein n=1 Tax=Aeromicrobium yanjiei TaxID=2662028 RepID=A0A5Q2MMQ9_9ACTN|nr:DUF4349 domain-containing protein [Aeromicrobium yanjiei]QGG42402.1 DUF4349 domain-containing protein [Aeromicrobium yanjiei]